jgi:hypothetical protein
VADGSAVLDAAYSRRRFLQAAAGVTIGSLSLPAVALGEGAAASTAAATGAAQFVSEPGLRPPTLSVKARTDPVPGYVFVSTLTGPGQRGPMIVDNHGEVVWFRPVKTVAVNFRRQRLAEQPVLTWWEGAITNIGTGQGENLIVDGSYRTIARVGAGNGYHADVHEFLLTSKGTALITVYNEKTVDLSSVGGPANGNVLDSIVQEVDVKTGKVLFEWHSLDHVPLTDSYSPLLDPFDYFHVNSVDVDLDGNLLLSARNTSAVYKIERTSGDVMWTLGGRSSDFEVGPGAAFMYQHDARGHSDGTLTLFDDGTGNVSHQARGIRLGLDVPGRRCVLLQQYLHPTPLAVNAMGNAQVLPGNGMLVGFGTQPFVTEYGPAGDVRFDAEFDGGAWNYRAFRDVWVGRPTTRPKLAIGRAGASTVARVSWNGSTETRSWRVVAGRSPRSVRHVKTVPRTGFETVIDLAGRPAYLQVEALDASGRKIGSTLVRSTPSGRR